MTFVTEMLNDIGSDIPGSGKLCRYRNVPSSRDGREKRRWTWCGH
jgi:hypothetical protein